MLGDDAVPSCTWHVPSLMTTCHWPPLSPLRLNWMVEFMPFAASAFRFLGISAKISLGVMQTPPLGGGVRGCPRASSVALSRTTAVRIVKRARGVALGARTLWVEPRRHHTAGAVRRARPSRARPPSTGPRGRERDRDRQRGARAVGRLPRARALGAGGRLRPHRSIHVRGGRDGGDAGAGARRASHPLPLPRPRRSRLLHASRPLRRPGPAEPGRGTDPPPLPPPDRATRPDPR